MDSLSYDLWSWGKVFESISSRSSLSSSRVKLSVAIAFNIILIGSSRQDREQLSTDRKCRREQSSPGTNSDSQ